MKFLQPDAERRENGVLIREKIIPWGSTWPRDAAGFRKGEPFKADLLLSGGTGRPRGVTIHNTGRITVNPQTTPAEQYTRATWPNANMNSVRVHYYVDAAGAWQNLREDEVGWHTGDGTYGKGNNTTIAIEIIMDGSGDADDLAAEENGARLAASILHRHGLTVSEMYTHRELSPVGKYCPQYLLPRWEEFRQRVGGYLAALGESEGDEPDGSEVSGGAEASEGAEVSGGVGETGGTEASDGADVSGGGKVSGGAGEPDGGNAAASQDTDSADSASGSGGLYRVQVGAFGRRENAERLAERLRSEGYSCFIRRDGE